MASKKVTFSDGIVEHVYPDKNSQNSKKSKTMEVEDFMVNMINNYVSHYKKVNNKGDNFTILDGINFNDVTSTNAPLENFYEEMLKYKINENTNPDYIKIYQYFEKDKMKIIDELYCIIKNGTPILLSTSFFSLLIELTNLKNENSEKVNYDIVSLK